MVSHPPRRLGDGKLNPTTYQRSVRWVSILRFSAYLGSSEFSFHPIPYFFADGNNKLARLAGSFFARLSAIRSYSWL